MPLRTPLRPHLGSLALSALLLAALTGCTSEGGSGNGGAAGSSATGGEGGAATGTTSAASTASTTSTTDGQLFEDPPEGSFPCGPHGYYCMKDTEYCKVDVDGPCCGASYSCAPLPAACQEDGAACECFAGESCICGGWQCDEGIGTSCEHDEAQGTFSFHCLHP